MGNTVKFKQGLSTSLPAIDPGSIIITTDTGKMYVDTDSENRKQIGGDGVAQSYVDDKLAEKQDKHKYIRYNSDTSALGDEGYTDVLVTGGTFSITAVSALYDLKSLFIAKDVILTDGGSGGVQKINIDFSEINLTTTGPYTVPSNIHFVGFTTEQLPLFTEEKTSVKVNNEYQRTWDADTKLDKSVIPTASTQDNGKAIIVGADGKYTLSVVSGGGTYTLPIASNSVLGGIKVGENLSITEDGVLNATAGAASLEWGTF